MTNIIEETAQKIQDYFFERGATIKKQDWCWLIGILQKDRADLVERVEKILEGIDQTEIESELGWWETSTGAKFGKKKLDDLIQLLKE
jgi:hypothetical protein